MGLDIFVFFFLVGSVLGGDWRYFVEDVGSAFEVLGPSLRSMLWAGPVAGFPLVSAKDCKHMMIDYITCA
jgi:hypothetical protein